ncbi:MAG TPA: CDP-alcohol phosphatidyltransferase family protein [Candidatus Methylomirabilis sp.]|nr:CDP-alcohol phosphatidyltransferase family protein [Candidatus Methylomirabilis sp.]
MANALTGVRLLLAVPFALLMASGSARSAVLAALTLAAAIATDLLDGPVARRRGTATAAGTAFDHTADVVFLASGLVAGAVRGAFPWMFPAVVLFAFVQYVVDSYWVDRRPALRPSRLGRYNGILYFIPLGGDILVRMGLGALRPLVTVITWMLVVSTVVSIGQRLAASWGRREELPRCPPEKDEPQARIEQDEEVVLDESERGHGARMLGKQQDPEQDRH